MNGLLQFSWIACLISITFFACNKVDSPETDEKPIKEDIIVIEVVDPADPIELTVRQGDKVDADNYFSFKIFKEVSVLNGENTFFSPLSLNLALGMLYNGASGLTREEMAEALGIGDFTETEINEYYQKMSQALLNIDPLTEIGIANSIWYREGFPVKQSFLNVNQTYFDAMVRALNFSHPDAAGIINKWCAEKTNDRIKEIIQSPIDDMTVMFLINALYFKSKWQFEFERELTKHDDFTLTDNRKIKVNLMEQTTALPYYGDQYLQCVEMPYGNEAFSMVAILPAANMSIEQLIDYLDNAKWKDILDKMFPYNIKLKLPRFKIECEMSLKEPVKAAGMKRIFVPFDAEFDHIADNIELNVSGIRQKTFVEVNEEGTEAAAVTVIEIVTAEMGPPPGPIPFFANRPFLYLIKEKSTGAILFIGRMDEPKE
jgi:serpin B